MPENEKPKEPQAAAEPKKYVVEDTGLPGGRVEIREDQVADYLKDAVRARRIEADAQRRVEETEARAQQFQALDYIQSAIKKNPQGIRVLEDVVSDINRGLTPEQIKARLAGTNQRMQDDPTDDEGGVGGMTARGPSPDVEALKAELQGELQAMRQRMNSLQVEGEKKSLLSEVTALVSANPAFPGEVAKELAVAQVMQHLNVSDGKYSPRDVTEAVAQRFREMRNEEANAERQQRDRSARNAPMPNSASTPSLSEAGAVEPPKYKDWKVRGGEARRNFRDALIATLEGREAPGTS